MGLGLGLGLGAEEWEAEWEAAPSWSGCPLTSCAICIATSMTRIATTNWLGLGLGLGLGLAS